jgi:hypothetical protein
LLNWKVFQLALPNVLLYRDLEEEMSGCDWLKFSKFSQGNCQQLSLENFSQSQPCICTFSWNIRKALKRLTFWRWYDSRSFRVKLPRIIFISVQLSKLIDRNKCLCLSEIPWGSLAGYLDLCFFRITNQCHIIWFRKICSLLRLELFNLNFVPISTFHCRHPCNESSISYLYIL